jgi:hypothetical protein
MRNFFLKSTQAELDTAANYYDEHASERVLKFFCRMPCTRSSV